jgi:hypothetical protein
MWLIRVKDSEIQIEFHGEAKVVPGLVRGHLRFVNDIWFHGTDAH